MKYEKDQRIMTFIKGDKQQGKVLDSWFDGYENRYLVSLGKLQLVWSISEKWLKPSPPIQST